MATQIPELVPQDSLPSSMHRNATWICMLADKYEVVHLADRITLFVSACATNGKSLDDKANLNMLAAKQYQPGQLAQNWPAKP
jgi:hypothetical protein